MSRRRLAGLSALLSVLLGLGGAGAAQAALTTEPATDVLARSVVLNGKATGSDASGECYFLYFVNGGAPQTTQTTPCGATFSFKERGLPPGSEVIYKARHCNQPANLTCNSNDFTQAPDQDQVKLRYPSGDTRAATVVRGSTARLNATIDRFDAGPELVQYFFRFSTDPTLANATETPMRNAGVSNANAGRTFDVSADLAQLSPDTTYYFDIEVRSGETPVAPPESLDIESFKTGGTVRTGAPSVVGETTATLVGEVNGGDADVDAAFLYGTRQDLQGATRVSAGRVNAAETTKTVSAQVTGLVKGTTYYVRLVAGPADALQGTTVAFTTTGGACPAGQDLLAGTALAGTAFRLTGCWRTDGAKRTSSGAVRVNGVLFTPKTSGGTMTIDTAAKRISSTEGFQVSAGDTVMRSSGQPKFDAAYETSGSFVLDGAKEASALKGFPLLGGLRMNPDTGTSDAAPDGGAAVTLNVVGPAFFGITGEGSVFVDGAGRVTGLKVQIGNTSIGPINLPGITFQHPYVDPTGKVFDGTWRADLNLVLPGVGKGIAANLLIKDNKPSGGGIDVGGLNVALGNSGGFLQRVFANLDFTPPGFQIEGGIGITAGPKIPTTIKKGEPFINVPYPGGAGSGSVIARAAETKSYEASLLGIDAQATVAMGRNFVVRGLGDYGVPDGTVVQDVPLAVDLSGKVSLFNLELLTFANVNVQYIGIRPDPLFSISANFGFNFAGGTGCADGGKAFGLRGNAGVRGAGQNNQFAIRAGAELKIRVLCKELGPFVNIVISNTGIGACLGFSPFGSVSGAIKWKSGQTSGDVTGGLDFDLTGCGAFRAIEPKFNLTSMPRTAAVGQPRTAQAQSRARTVQFDSGDAPLGLIVLKSSSGVPRVRISSPGRPTLETSTTEFIQDRRGLALPMADRNELQVQVPRPGRAKYKIEVLPGSGPLTKISIADGREVADVSARVEGKGAQRTLRWNAEGLGGRTLVFREAGAGVLDVITRTTKERGSVRFTPTRAAGTSRRITAEVLTPGNAVPKLLKLARFKATPVPAAARVKGLRLVRRGTTVVATWKGKPRRGERYQAAITIGDGRRLRVNRAKSGLRVPGVELGDAVTVAITGFDALGRDGRPVRRTLAGGRAR